MGRKGETTGYVPSSFEEFYTRKLEALQVRLKNIIYGGLPYVTNEQYACKVCKGRLKVHIDGRIYCLKCRQMPGYWTQAIKDRIEAIMQAYPDVEECAQEWRKSRPQHQPQDRTPEAVAFGARIEEARLAKGWSHEQLAEKIIKNARGHLSPATIRMIEKGSDHCSQCVREQLIKVLGLREGVVC